MENIENDWYSVKCLFYHPTRKKEDEMYLYEERITLWYACSFEQAYDKAQEEAVKYAKEANAFLVSPTDSFHLFDNAITEGVEIYSIMRGSNLTPEIYRNTFCNTDRDRLK